jgi:hypothetical protein
MQALVWRYVFATPIPIAKDFRKTDPYLQKRQKAFNGRRCRPM